MKTTIANLKVVSCIHGSSRIPLQDALKSEGYHVFEIAGQATNIASVFQQMRIILPLDPPISGAVNLDALADSLWEGLDQLAAEKVAILLHNAEVLANNDLENLLLLVGTLQSVATMCNDRSTGIKKMVTLIVVLLGDGPSFRTYS